MAALRLLPRPRCYRQVTAVSPWVAIDPVLWADCALAWRGVRLALVAVLALLGGSRSALAANGAMALCPAVTQDRRGEAEGESRTERAQSGMVERKQWERIFARRVLSLATFLSDWFRPMAAQIDLERAHGPPARRLIPAFIRVSIRTANVPPAASLPVLTALRRSLPFIFPASFFSSAKAARLDCGGCGLARQGTRSTVYPCPFPIPYSGEITHVCC